MQQFTGIEYIAIDVANHFGKDKLTWDNRLLWFYENYDSLYERVDEADSPMLAIKGLKAYQDALKGKPTGFIMGLDATASGLQILACMSDCAITAEAVNLVDPTERKDVYTEVTETMNLLLPKDHYVTRAMAKKPLMTHFYSKKRQTEAFNPQQEAAFYKAIDGLFPGAESAMELIQNAWNVKALFHEWTAPDGHVAHVKVVEPAKTRFTIDELNVQVTFAYTANKSSVRNTSLCPNVVHTVDGWIAREMVRRAKQQGFQLACIHDSFWASPNYMNQVRQNYVDILSDFALINYVQSVYRQISGNEQMFIERDGGNVSELIRQSEYALS